MSFLQDFIGGPEQLARYQSFVERYELGWPFSQIPETEATTLYNSLAERLRPDVYQEAVESALRKLPPEGVLAFGRWVVFHLMERGLPVARPETVSSEELLQVPTVVSELTARLQADSPTVLSQQLGLGLGGPLLDNDVAKGVIAGIVAFTLTRILQTP